MGADTGIETLLDLHGQLIDQEAGYWIKIEAWRVQASEGMPHGIRYSLSLHEPDGDRILGYDNAHPVRRPGKFKYAGTRHPFDHVHRYASIVPEHYEFQGAWQLLSDFFAEVDKVLARVRKP